MVKVSVGGAQSTPPLLKVGVTTIVAITGLSVSLTASKELILLDPKELKLMDGLSLVHK